MIKVTGKFTNSFTVELDINSFEDIYFEKMSREESDELIRDAILKKYGDCADKILYVNEVKS
jgi:hypothetical protein